MDDPPCESQEPSSRVDRERWAAALFEQTFRAKGDFTVVYPDEFLSQFPDPLRQRAGWFEQYLRERRMPVFANGAETEPPLYSEEFGVGVRVLNSEQEARVHACRSFGRRAWSLTVRWSAKLSKEQKDSIGERAPSGDYESELGIFRPDGLVPADASGKSKAEGDGAPRKREHLSSFAGLVRLINTQFKDAVPWKGLILVAGETGCGKSNVVRGLIYAYLRRLHEINLSRKPHLITFEDPVEAWFRRIESLQAKMGADAGQPGLRPAFHVDYTPRMVGRGLDCPSVEEGLMRDALRQTPAVAYVGEVRKQQDFRACLDFAGTGHLVFATAHAGSVVEAMAKVLSSADAKTPGTRAVVASRILGVVHLKRLPTPRCEGVHDIERALESPTVPAIWRRTQTGVQQLVADGLASVLPTGPATSTKDAFCLGRLFFANEILNDVTKGGHAEAMTLSEPFIRDLRRSAREDDLNG